MYTYKQDSMCAPLTCNYQLCRILLILSSEMYVCTLVIQSANVGGRSQHKHVAVNGGYSQVWIIGQGYTHILQLRIRMNMHTVLYIFLCMYVRMYSK